MTLIIGMCRKAAGSGDVVLNIAAKFHISRSIKGDGGKIAIMVNCKSHRPRPIKYDAVKIFMGGRAHRHA